MSAVYSIAASGRRDALISSNKALMKCPKSDGHETRRRADKTGHPGRTEHSSLSPRGRAGEGPRPGPARSDAVSARHRAGF